MADITRNEWIERSTEENLKVVDNVFTTLNEVTGRTYEPGFTASFIGARLNGKASNFITVVPQKKAVQLNVRLDESFIVNQAISAVVGDNFRFQNYWYSIRIDADTDLKAFAAILMQAEKEYFAKKGQVLVDQLPDIMEEVGQEAKEALDSAKGFFAKGAAFMSEKIDAVKEGLKKQEAAKETATQDDAAAEPAKTKYWIFVEADLVRAYVSDEQEAMDNYKSYNEDFEGSLADAVEEEGENSFVTEYMGDNYTDYFTRVYKVGVVKVDDNRELSEYYSANGEGFDYVEYEDGYGSCYEDEELSPRDFNGLLGWQENSHNISVYELEAEDFDIENLDINTNYVYYDGDELDQINVDGDEGDITMYQDGTPLL